MTVLAWMPDILADEFRGSKGFQVDVVSGWRTRSARTTTFRPIGVMNHHTGRGSYAALLNYMSGGSSIAPLCNCATSRPNNGIVRVTIVAAGRANHAGTGSWSWAGVNGGNLHCIGNEHQNDGRQSWPSQQVEAIHRMSAAQLRYLKQPQSRVIDHKDYAPTRKVDRHSVNRAQEQAAIGRILSSPPNTGLPGMENDVIKRGDRGGQVSYWQRRINDCFSEMRRLNRGDIPRDLQADGIFGQLTEDGVKRVQQNVKFPQTGVIDLTTAIYIQALAHSGGAHR